MSMPLSLRSLLPTLLPSFFLLAGPIGGALILRSAILEYRRMERTVEVRGLAEREVTSDQALLTLPIIVLGNELRTTQKEIASQLDKSRQFVLKAGFDENEIQMSSPQVTDFESGNFYGSQKPRFRYSTRATLSISSQKMKAIEKLKTSISALGEAGIAIENPNIQYYFTNLNSVKPDMLAEATRNAREAAEKFAIDSNSRLGSIKTAHQGLFSIQSRFNDYNDPSAKEKKIRVVTRVEFYIE